MTARPSPLRAATTGSSTGSAYGATRRITTWAPTTRRGQPAAVADDVGRHLALDADADRGVAADADGEGQDEQEQLGPPAAAVDEAHQCGVARQWSGPAQPVPPSCSGPTGSRCCSAQDSSGRSPRQKGSRRGCRWGTRWGLGRLGRVRRRRDAVGRDLLDVSRASARSSTSMLLDQPSVARREVLEPQVGHDHGVREREPGQRGVDAAEDHDRAVLLADVVLALGPGPGHGGGDPDDAQDDGGDQQAAQPGEARRRARGVARGLGVDRVAGDGVGRDVEDLGVDRLELAGVAGAVPAEEGRGAGGA